MIPTKLPLHIFILPVAAICSLLAVFFADLHTKTWVLDLQHHYPIVRTIAFAFTLAGYNFYMFIAMAIIAMERVCFSTPQNPFKKLADHCFIFLCSAVLAGAVVHLVKFIVGRYRPSSGQFTYELFSGHISFPSGHSQTIFTVILYLICAFRLGPVLNLLLVIFASFVASSRIFLNHHFLSDVIMGAALGGYISFIIVKKIDTIRKNKTFLFPEHIRIKKRK